MSKFKEVLNQRGEEQFRKKLETCIVQFCGYYNHYTHLLKRYNRLEVDSDLSDKVKDRKQLFEAKSDLLHAINVFEEMFGKNFINVENLDVTNVDHKVFQETWDLANKVFVDKV